MIIKTKIILGAIPLMLVVTLFAASIKYFTPITEIGNEVLIAGFDDRDHADKIEVFCHDRLSLKDAAHQEFRDHPHGAFITVDQNKNGIFDDDTRRPLVGFEGDNEVTIETYGGN
ncbi:MAG: hypothetical protein HQM16_11800, partial [Deltaproteobacteria bacterium]|nr:hypothetical protein [Deltaproteobacteria bacterium]